MLAGLLDYVNLSAALFSSGLYEESLVAADTGLAYAPENPELHVGRAKALVILERYEEALAAAGDALRLSPQHIEAHTTRGFAYEGLGQNERAIECVRTALALDPQSIEAHGALGTLLLWQGDLLGGLPHQEFHWLPESAYLASRFATDVCWDSGDPAGLRLLVVHNQGLGDLIQIARYFPLLRQRAAQLTVECPPALRALFERIPGVDAVVERDAPAIAGQYDAYVRAMSLPRLFATERDTIPAAVPYLRADPALRETQRARMGDGPGVRVGIAWAGNPLNWRDRERSIPLDAFAVLADVPDIRWFSLQAGERANDAAPDALQLVRLGAEFITLDDAAAAICELDLIISVDSSMCHLAGALGKPVWTLVGRRPDWRWERAGDRTRWYPTMRLFRQPARGDWPDALRSVREALARLP